MNDGIDNSNTATVSITVNPINDVPLADSQFISLDEDTSIAINLTASDIDGDVLIYTITQQPQNGTLSGSSPNLTYTPNANYNGNDSFTFVSNDGTDNSNTAIVDIVINSVNDLPVANDQTVATNEEEAISITLTASDIEVDPLTYNITQQPSNGAITGVAPNLTYTPNQNFNGNDSLSFQVNDGLGDSNIATVSIDVVPINDEPVISITSPSGMLIFTDTDIINFAATANDIEDGDINNQIVWTASPNIALGTGEQINATLAAGNYIVAAEITDSDGASVSDTIIIQVVSDNSAPVAYDVSVQTTINQSLIFELNANDFDGDLLSYNLDSTPTSGTVILNNNQVTYTPNTDFIGQDSFTYYVNDGQNDSNTAQVTINIVADNSVPEIISLPVIVGVEGEVYRYQVEAIDPNNETLTYSLYESPAGMTINSQTGLIEWNDALRGAYQVIIRATNTSGAFAEQNYELIITPPLPEVTHEGTEFWFSYFQNADGIGGSSIPYLKDSPPEKRLLYISSRTNANITIEIPNTGFIENYQVGASEVLTIDLSDYTQTTTGNLSSSERYGFASFGIETYGDGVYISSDQPINAYLLSRTVFSTDASIIYPTKALGKKYSVATYNEWPFNSSLSNPYPTLFGIVAKEDNTNVTISLSTHTIDRQKETPYQIILNKGQAYQMLGISNNGGIGYNSSDNPSYLQEMDLSGSTIESDKPIAVFSGHNCANVGVSGACDHLIEQLTPTESLGVEYITMPLATRREGDFIRIYAVEDATRVKVDEELVSYINAGENHTLEGVTEPSVIKANKPIQVMQFSTSCRWDGASFNGCFVKADPFMSEVPSVGRYLNYYQVTTPADGFESHHINLIIEDSVKHTVRLNDEAVDETLWQTIPNTEYVGAQIPVAAGAYTAYAAKPFGLNIYGFNAYDSYGYIGGVSFPDTDTPSKLILNVDKSAPKIGENVCINATLIDDLNKPISQNQVSFSVVNDTIEYDKHNTTLTNQNGIAQYCYTRGISSLDNITVKSSSLIAETTINWSQYYGSENLPPVIESTPYLFVKPDEWFTHQIQAYDPEGHDLTYSFVRSYSRRTHTIESDTGFVRIRQSRYSRPGDLASYPIKVCDSMGLCAEETIFVRILSNMTTDPSVPNIQNTTLELGYQNQDIEIDFKANDPNFFEIFRWELLKNPSGSSINYFSSDFDWSNPEVSKPGRTTSFNQYCAKPDATVLDFSMNLKWMQENGPTSSVFVGYLYDSNNDGQLDRKDRKAIIGTRNNGIISVDALSGDVIWHRSDLYPNTNVDGLFINIDNDNTSEFIFIEQESNKIIALNYDGSTRWISEEPAVSITNGYFNFVDAGLVPTDLDGDDEYEIVISGSVFGAEGELLWRFAELDSYEFPSAYVGNTIAIDLDLDGYKEVIFAGQVRDWQGNLLWTLPKPWSQKYSYSRIAFGNLDDDPQMEIVQNIRSSNSYLLQLIDNDGQLLLWDKVLGTSGNNGKTQGAGISDIVISDMNNDGESDIYLPSANRLIDKNGEDLWVSEVQRDFKNASVADINGDGLLEILAKDYEDNLYGVAIYNAATGEKIRNVSNYTTSQSPVFVDVDNDGQGEIITSGAINNTNIGIRGAVSIFNSRDASWNTSSDIYAFRNQPYAAVSENMRLTGSSETHAGQINLKSNNTKDFSGNLSDLMIEYVRVNSNRDEDKWDLEYSILNKGRVDIAEGALLEFYRDDPAVVTNKFGEVILPAFSIEETVKGFFSFNDYSLMGDEVFAVVKLQNSFEECIYDNNIASAKVIGVQVMDNIGLIDHEYWALGLREKISNPEFISSPILDAKVNQLYQYQVIAEDRNADDLITFHLTRAPNGMSINEKTGLISWVPNYKQAGINRVQVRLEDLNMQGKISNLAQSFIINVETNLNTGSNQYPQITSAPNFIAEINKPYEYSVKANDPEGEYLSYEIISAPTEMSINNLSGELRWTPDVSDIGVHPITIRVIDTYGLATEQSYDLQVRDNNAPNIEDIAHQTALIGKNYNVVVSASDPDGDSISYHFINAPTGMAIDSVTGLIEWQPVSSDFGNYSITVRVTDQLGSFADTSFELLARNNSAPTMSPITDYYAIAERDYLTQVNAVDPDDDVIAYALVDAPTGMSIDAITGIINWTPTLQQVGDYSITVTAIDPFGEGIGQTYTLFVTANQIPLIQPIQDAQVFFGNGYQYQVMASDADGDTLTYNLSSSPIGMTIDSNGDIAWLPELSQLGDHVVEVSVNDNFGGVSNENFVISVVENQVPIITSTPVTDVMENRLYNYDVNAYDPDGTDVNYSLDVLPAGMAIDNITGVINWIPTDSQLGANNVAVRITDSDGYFVIHNFTINVVADTINEPPSIETSPTTIAYVDLPYSYDVDATDINNDTLSYTLEFAPTGMLIDSVSGLITWTPDSTQLGLHTVSIRVLDGNGGYATQNYSIAVNAEPNTPPEITSTSIKIADVGILYEYDVEATDDDNDTLIYSLDVAPSGMSINSATGLIAWIPDNTQIGLNNVTVLVEDGNGGGATQSFSINVISAVLNQTPVIHSQPILTASVDNLYQYTIDATDVENDPLVYTLIAGPAGMVMSIDGAVTWTPDANQVGSYDVAVRVSDAESFSQQHFTLLVANEPIPFSVQVQADPPILELGESTTITVVTSGGVDAITMTLSINGVDIPLDSAGQAIYSGDAYGIYEMLVTATDNITTVAADGTFSVRDPSDVTPPVAVISSPITNAEITAPIDIIGTATDDNLLDYTLYISPSNQDNFTKIASGNASISNDVLGQFDPTMLVNGQYDVLLSVRDNNGQESQALTTYVVAGNLKVGEFSFSIEDITTPAAGMPISVVRAYDSRRRDVSGDFGYGGNLETEATYLRGKSATYGKKGSTRLDVYDPATGDVYDYKFVVNSGKGISTSQQNKIRTHGPAGVNNIIEVNP